MILRIPRPFRRKRLAKIAPPFFFRSIKVPQSRRARPSSGPEHYLCVATVLRNEGEYVREWLAFQKAVGVDHVVIYDNESTDGFQDRIRDHLASGFVEIIPWPHFAGKINFQQLGFAHAVSHMSGRTTWLALIDLDEFLYSTEGLKLSATLQRYEDLPALNVYWMNYGTSGHKTRQVGLVIENYTLRAADNNLKQIKNVKSIVQPHRVKAVLGVHRFLTDLDPIIGFNEKRMPLTHWGWRRQPHTADILRINHYYSRSREEFDSRLPDRWGRYRPELYSSRAAKLRIIEQNQVLDDSIVRFIPHMQPWLGAGAVRPAATLVG